MQNVERIDQLFDRIENIGAAVDAADNRARRLAKPRVYFRNMFNQDPFDYYGADEFKGRYRFTKHTVENVILPQIEGDIHSSVGNRGLPLTARIKLLIALRFYATGSFQTVCGDIISISQPTVCRVIAQVSLALAKQLPRYIHFPNNTEQQQNIKNQFEQLGRSPTRRGLNNIIGAIDCTHIKINRPRNVNHSEAYRNRKGIFSINTQVITGPNMEIFDIVVRWPGSSHDSRIFRNSRAFRQFSRGEINGIIVGDSGYPSLTFMLTPLLQATTRAEINYNYAQVRTRNIIERFFGVWKRKFPCLQLGLRTKLRTSTNIIIACAVLHNIGIAYGDNYEENQNLIPPQQMEIRPVIPSSAQGLAMRQAVIAQFN
ncbi:putative nuclease HARBI1 [Colias croceus]|uniref:putative nuclease HARBI1 n=1 Tax=Colias crocea TaxID=72248 RepID=UPI001E281852|nr:putative nuclease HARBI1 [Colias croceus]